MSLWPFVASSAQEPRSICDRPGFPAPELCRRAQLDSARARFVLLLDGSGSMRPRWSSVATALGNLAGAIPDGDELDVKLFAGDSRTLVSATPSSDAVRRSWQRTLQSQPTPTGTSTDLGLAAETALDAIKDADAGQLQYIFFLTDGRHQPSWASKYTGAGAPGAWRELALRADALQRARPLHVVIIRLDVGAESERLTQVFRNSVVIDALSSDDLSRWFDRLTRQLAVEKLSALIQSELARPAATLSAATGQSVHAGRETPVSASVIAARRIVRTAIPQAVATTTEQTGAVTIPAGALETDGTVDVQWTGPTTPIWTPAWGGLEASEDTLVIQTEVGPREELDRLGIVRRSNQDRIVLASTVARRGALPDWLWWLVAVGMVLTVALAVRRTRWALHRPRLSGSLIVKSATGAGAGTTHRLSDVPAPVFEVKDLTGNPVLTIQATSERGRTVLVASPTQPAVTMNGKQAPRSTALTTRVTFRTPDVEIVFIPS